MNRNKKFVILLELLLITFLVISVVPVCGLSDSSADIYAYPSIVNPGDEITVTFSGAPGFELDWIAMYKVGDPNEEEYDMGYYLAGEKSGTLFFTAPDEPGDYEFRLFEDDGYTDITRSNVVRVQAGTTVPTPTPTTLSGVHHLGDQTMSDWEVPKPEGTEYTTTFSLNAVPASADLILDVFDTDYNNPVLVNGNSVGIVCINTIESWKQCTIEIPGSALRVGSNTLTIQSESRGGNYDDFMIENIGVTPSSGVHRLGDQTLSDWEVPKPEGTEYTTTFSLNAVPASADLILDVFNTDYNNPVLVNGNSVGILCINTIKSWKLCTIKIPGSALRVGSNTLTIQSESRGGNYDDFMIRNIEVTPSSDAQPTTPTPTPPEFSVLVFESRSKSSGSTVQIPLTLQNATDKIGNMDITLGYEPSVLDATEVIKGGLTTTSLFEYNLIDGGTIKINLTDKAGFSGDGSIAYVKFNVIGSEGSVSPLKIVSLSANRAKDMAPLSITPQDGVFTVLGFAEGRGDCDGFDKKDTDEPSEETLAIDAFLSNLSNLDVNFNSGTFSASDTDNDGKDDIYSYTFEEEDVAEGLSLERKVEYENTDEGLMGSLTLDFENTWGEDDTKSYTHRETIPKSFAGNVDDLKFSVEPDRIVNPDPEVQWVIDRMVKDISVDVKNDALSAAKDELTTRLGWWGMGMLATKVNLTALANVVSSGGTVTEKIDKLNELIEGAGLTPAESAAIDKAAETGMSVAVGTALEHFDDFKAIHELAKCKGMDSDVIQRNICFMAVIAKYPDSFTESDCYKFHFDETTHKFLDAASASASSAACKSVISGDINHCIPSLGGRGLDKLSREKNERYCRMHVFNFYVTRCMNIQDPQTKKDCLFLSAIESGSADACKSKYAALDERQKKVCLAMNTQNISYCRGMKNEEDWKNCCELLNPDLKEDCLKKEECDDEHLNLCDNEKDCGDAGGYWYNSQCNKEEEKEECDNEHLSLCDNEKGCGDAGGYWYSNQCNVNPEEDTSDGDTFDGEFSCPIPKDAKHMVVSREDYWVMPNTDKKVGPSLGWYDIEKTKKWYFRCYNADGKLHGVSKRWYEDGTPKYEGNYKDGKLHGVGKTWYEDGTPKYEGNYKDGRSDGVYKEWREDGTLEYEWNYKDGKKHGVCKTWSDNGKLISECNYEEDTCVSCVHGHC